MGKGTAQERLTRGSPLPTRGGGRGHLGREETDVEDSSVPATNVSVLPQDRQISPSLSSATHGERPTTGTTEVS